MIILNKIITKISSLNTKRYFCILTIDGMCFCVHPCVRPVCVILCTQGRTSYRADIRRTDRPSQSDIHRIYSYCYHSCCIVKNQDDTLLVMASYFDALVVASHFEATRCHQKQKQKQIDALVVADVEPLVGIGP